MKTEDESAWLGREEMEEERERKRTNRSFGESEIRVDERSKTDDLGSFLEVEEEK